MAMIDHPQAPVRNDPSQNEESRQTASERPIPSRPFSHDSPILHEFMRRTASDDLWFGYEVDMDTAHLWFTVEQEAAISEPIDESLSLLIDDRTEELIGFTIEGFREEYLRQATTWDLLLHRTRLRQSLNHDIPMTKVSSLQESSQPAIFTRVATSAAFESLLADQTVER